MLVAGTQCHGLEHQDQQGQPHGELRKQVVKRNSEREMQSMNGEGVHAFHLRAFVSKGFPRARGKTLWATDGHR